MIPKCPGRANGNAWRRNSPSCPSRPPATDELALTPAEDTTRWEFLEWQIQRAQRRLATIESRLAVLGPTEPRAHDNPSPPGRSPSGGRALPIASQAQVPAQATEVRRALGLVLRRPRPKN